MRLLKKYLFNFTSNEEEKELFDNSRVDKALFDAWNHFSDIKTKENLPDSDKIFTLIQEKANIPIKKEQISGNNFRIKLMSLAAIAILFLATSLFLYNHFFADPIIVVSAEKGQRKDITLPDGTRVWLNADTKIRYHKKFNGLFREIYISGEAYFSVVKDSLRPFIVKTSQLDIKVLGTVFNVKSYPEDKTIETILVSGSVIIEKKEKKKNDNPVLLLPKQKAIFSCLKNNIVIEKVIPEKNISWKSGRLIFDNEPINLVLEKLERWYGVNIQLEIKNKDTAELHDRYTLTIKDENIEEVIKLMQLTTKLTFKITDPAGSFTRIYEPDHNTAP